MQVSVAWKDMHSGLDYTEELSKLPGANWNPFKKLSMVNKRRPFADHFTIRTPCSWGSAELLTYSADLNRVLSKFSVHKNFAIWVSLSESHCFFVIEILSFLYPQHPVARVASITTPIALELQRKLWSSIRSFGWLIAFFQSFSF